MILRGIPASILRLREHSAGSAHIQVQCIKMGKIEPLKYDAARKTFLSNIESVHQQAVMNFFACQGSDKPADGRDNFSNADTLTE